MSIFSSIKNLYSKKYSGADDAIVISCYFNPQESPYRLKAFKIFYDSIKHLNHMIIECVIGNSKPQLEQNENIQRVYTENLLWHKEALLNTIVKALPKKYKYVFWVDADVLFTNKDWLVEGVAQLQKNNIVQPFEYCVHLEKDETKPDFDTEPLKWNSSHPALRHPKMWRSFCANFATDREISENSNYDVHGHVGFAWGARREVLEAVPLYDRALIGGADHIIAHAAAGQIPHTCITKSFTENIDEVNEWSKQFYSAVQGKISYVKGDLYHIWHGDIDKRQYLKRIQDYTPTIKQIKQKDSNGLYITNKGDDEYVKRYFAHREVAGPDNSFLESMMLGYVTDSALAGGIIGGNFLGAMVGEEIRDLSKDDSQNFS